MNKINYTLITALFAFLLISCGDANEKKLRKYNELREESKQLALEVKEMEQELLAEGILKAPKVNKILVTQLTVAPTSFVHKVEMRGAVASRKDVLVSAETMGKIKSIVVKEGQQVKKGQVLMYLESEVLTNAIAEIETQLELAKTIFERQSRLWEQNIGTEVQYLQAKNNKEALEKRLATQKAQLDQFYVVAPFGGVIDHVAAKVGEMVQPGLPLLRIISPDDVYINSDISESYLGKFRDGQQVEVYFPTQDKTVASKITSVGQVIKSENRTFEVQVGLPVVPFGIKPNQVVVLNMVDYSNESALVVPTKIIQKDSKGSYVYELTKEGEATVANKIYVETGVSYNLQTEILSGLKAGQVIANEGHRELSQGVVVDVR